MIDIKKTLLLLFAFSSVVVLSQTKDDLQKLYEAKDYVAAVEMIKKIENKYKKDDRAQLLFGDVFFEMENIQEAYKYYVNAYEIEGDEHYILYRLSRANSRLGNHDRALNQMKDAIDDEDKIEYQIALIDVLAKKGDYDAARKQADRIIRDDPENLDALKFLGDVYHIQRVYDVSKDNYEKLLAIDSTYIDARINLAEAYYWLGQRTDESTKELGNMYFKKALEEYNKVTLQDPNNAKAYFEEGKILFWSNQFLPAAKALSKYVKLRPDGDLGRWFLAQSFNQLGSCDSAAPHLKLVAQRIDSVKEKASLMLARCYSDQREYAKAREEFEILSKTMALDLNDRRRLATATLFTGDTTNAIALYKELVQEAPEKQCQVMKTVGQLLVSMKQYDDALWFLNKRLALEACNDPATDALAYYYQGLCYLFTEKYTEAQKSLETAISLDSNNTQAILYLADAYVNLGQEDKALDEYKKIITTAKADTSKDNSRLLNSTYGKLASYYQKTKDYNTLNVISKEWVAIAPNSEYAFIYLGLSEQALQNVSEACKAYNKALEINPKNKTAKKLSGGLGC